MPLVPDGVGSRRGLGQASLLESGRKEKRGTGRQTVQAKGDILWQYWSAAIGEKITMRVSKES